MDDSTKPKIALLDDHEDTRELLEFALQSDFSVQGFSDASSLLEALETEKFDLIIADIMLPGIDGYDFLRTLRSDQRFSGIPVIAVTALAMPLDRKKVMEAGFTDYLIKPIQPQDVVDAIWRSLRAP